jgi:hypothetical protein
MEVKLVRGEAENVHSVFNAGEREGVAATGSSIARADGSKLLTLDADEANVSPA